MKKILVAIVAIAFVAVGSGFAQELTGLPAQPNFEGTYYKPTSVDINPLYDVIPVATIDYACSTMI